MPGLAWSAGGRTRERSVRRRVPPAPAHRGRAHPGRRGSAGGARRDASRGVEGRPASDDDRGRRRPIRARSRTRPTASRDRASSRVTRRPASHDEGPTWSATSSPTTRSAVRRATQPSGEVPPLPHWTEPPTGAVPAIFADADARRRRARRLGVSAAASPRFRAEGSDWADADFGGDDLTDDTTNGRRARRRRASSTTTSRSNATSPSAAAARRAAAPPARWSRASAAAGDAPAGRRPVRPPTPTPTRRRDLVPPGAARGRDLPTAIATAAAVARRRAHLLHAGHVLDRRCSPPVIVGVGTLEFSAALQARGFRPAHARSRSSARHALPLAARTATAPTRIPVFFGLIVVVLDALVPVGGHARPAAARRRDHGARVRVRRRPRRLRRACCSRRPTASASSSASRCASIAYDVVGFFVGSQFGPHAARARRLAEQDRRGPRRRAWSASVVDGRDRRS